MKITKLFLLVIAFIILFSCDKEEDFKATSQGMLGAWAVSAVDYKGSITMSGQGGSLREDYSGTGKDMNLTTTFNENPNSVTSQGSYTIVLKSTVMGQSETEEYYFDEI